jgi:hypothetical protein
LPMTGYDGGLASSPARPRIANTQPARM